MLLAPCSLLPIMGQTLSEQEIIQKMVSAAKEIRTVQCGFTQTRHLKMLSKEQVSQGKMYCQQPDKLRWEYISPRASTLIMNGTEVKTLSSSPTKGEESKAASLKGGLAGYMARMIMNSVAGKLLTDGKTFQITAEETPTEYVATLVPTRKEMKRMYAKIVLRFNIRLSTVTQVEMHEKSGESTIIELQDIRINEPINASTFSK